MYDVTPSIVSVAFRSDGIAQKPLTRLACSSWAAQSFCLHILLPYVWVEQFTGLTHCAIPFPSLAVILSCFTMSLPQGLGLQGDGSLLPVEPQQDPPSAALASLFHTMQQNLATTYAKERAVDRLEAQAALTSLAEAHAKERQEMKEQMASLGRKLDVAHAGTDRPLALMTSVTTFPMHECPAAFTPLEMTNLPERMEPGLVPLLDVDNDKLCRRIDLDIAGLREAKKSTEVGRFKTQQLQGLRAELPALLTGIALAGYVEHILAKVATEVRRPDADQEVVAAAVEGSASYLARWCGLVLRSRRSQIAFLVDRGEETAAGYADMAFGSQNSLVGSDDPIARTIIATQATALSARLAKEVDRAAAAPHKQSGGNKGWAKKAAAHKAKGAPAPPAK